MLTNWPSPQDPSKARKRDGARRIFFQNYDQGGPIKYPGLMLTNKK